TSGAPAALDGRDKRYGIAQELLCTRFSNWSATPAILARNASISALRCGDIGSPDARAGVEALCVAAVHGARGIETARRIASLRVIMGIPLMAIFTGQSQRSREEWVRGSSRGSIARCSRARSSLYARNGR